MFRRHLLAIGASGMLRGLCVDYARDGQIVTVVARTKESLAKMEAKGVAGLFGVSVDYRNGEALRSSLLDAQERRGPFGVSVAWLREDVAALSNIVEFLCTFAPSSHLFHIKGSASANWPSIKKDPRCQGFEYHQILLGSVKTALGRRWLTHPEIVSGVKRAIQDGTRVATVGERTDQEESLD